MRARPSSELTSHADFAFPDAAADPLGGTDYDSLVALGMALLPRLDGMGGL